MAKRKKKPATETPYSRISSILRRLWLWSPERRARLKIAHNQCEICGAKKDKDTKMYVHHVKPTDFRRIERVVREELLVKEDKLQCLCKECHHNIHHGVGIDNATDKS